MRSIAQCAFAANCDALLHNRLLAFHHALRNRLRSCFLTPFSPACRTSPTPASPIITHTRRAPLSPEVQSWAEEVALDEQGHVRMVREVSPVFARRALGVGVSHRGS